MAPGQYLGPGPLPNSEYLTDSQPCLLGGPRLVQDERSLCPNSEPISQLILQNSYS